MAGFQCDKCGCLESTSLSFPGCDIEWYAKPEDDLDDFRKKLGLKENESFGKYCSACCPLTEEWHGEFDRVYLPMGEFETGDNDNLRHRKTLDEDVRKFAIRIDRV